MRLFHFRNVLDDLMIPDLIKFINASYHKIDNWEGSFHEVPTFLDIHNDMNT
jgi:hypothetical protein